MRIRLHELWVYLLPALFLPNFGLGQETGFGTLEFADFLVGPYVVAVLLGRLESPRTQKSWELVLPMVGFVTWCLISSATIKWRYGYPGLNTTTTSLLKVAKLVVYGYAGYATAAAFRSLRHKEKFFFALLAGAISIAATTLYIRLILGITVERLSADAGFEASNSSAVALAIIMAAMSLRWIEGGGTKTWRRAFLYASPFFVLGLLLTGGRGGVGAFALAIAAMMARNGIRPQYIGLGIIVAFVATLGVRQFEFVQVLVDRTFVTADEQPTLSEFDPSAPPLPMRTTVDDGRRFTTWKSQAKHFVDAPLLGTGLFHRGGRTQLWFAGSHNFLLQMALETGLIGFLLCSRVFFLMAIGRVRHHPDGISLNAFHKAGILAALLASLTGEYFYGSLPLLSLFFCYAPIGAEPATTEATLRAEQSPSARPRRYKYRRKKIIPQPGMPDSDHTRPC